MVETGLFAWAENQLLCPAWHLVENKKAAFHIHFGVVFSIVVQQSLLCELVALGDSCFWRINWSPLRKITAECTHKFLLCTTHCSFLRWLSAQRGLHPSGLGNPPQKSLGGHWSGFTCWQWAELMAGGARTKSGRGNVFSLTCRPKSCP